jgi:hypothetical protein
MIDRSRATAFLALCIAAPAWVCALGATPLLSEEHLDGEQPTAPVLTRNDTKAAYVDATSLAASDPAAAFAEMTRLAASGYDRALDRLAYFHLKGIGTPVNAAAAVDLYRRAFEAGHERSLLSLGKVLLSRGRPGEALVALDRAVELNVVGAEATRALAHISSRFGPASDPKGGLADLSRLVASRERTAELGVLKHIATGAGVEIDESNLVEQLLQRSDDGDGMAAEVLLYYHRSRGSNGGMAMAARERLLAHPNIRAKIIAVEGLYLARDSKPARFWTEAEKIVDTTPGPDFARALVVTARINRNAYVRIVQKQLREFGYYHGRATAYLSGSTIRAVNRFCRDAGIWDACQSGPVKSTAVKAIAMAIAKHRQERTKIEEEQTHWSEIATERATENVGAKVFHGSGGIIPLRSA